MRELEQRVLAVASDLWCSSLRVAALAVGEVAIRELGNSAARWEATIADYAEVYAAIVGLVQPWRRRYPLLDGGGHFGSPYGDEPADLFYTEVRASAAGRALRDRIPYEPLLDEPLPHRWCELVAAVAIAREPHATLDDVLAVMPGPDLPTGGVLDRDEIDRLYRTGRGTLCVRSRVTIEGPHIVVRDAPWGMPFNDLTTAVCALPGLRDAWDAGTCRLDIEPQPGALDGLHAAVRACAQRTIEVDLGAPLLDRLRAIRDLPLVVDDERRTTIVAA